MRVGKVQGYKSWSEADTFWSPQSHTKVAEIGELILGFISSGSKTSKSVHLVIDHNKRPTFLRIEWGWLPQTILLVYFFAMSISLSWDSSGYWPQQLLLRADWCRLFHNVSSPVTSKAARDRALCITTHVCTKETELSNYLWLPSASFNSAFKMLRIRISMALAFYSVTATCHSSALPLSTVPQFLVDTIYLH